MKGVYTLPPKLGTTLILKVHKTEREIFSWNSINQYATADEMESKYSLKDHKIMILDLLYFTHGPVGCCGEIQDEYSIFLKNGRWPALKNRSNP